MILVNNSGLFYHTAANNRLQIFVGGDSAGGNLALGLMSHILHPHPNFQEKLRVNLPSPLAGAILTSPWCKFPFEDESAIRNEGSDFVCRVGGERWSSAFMGMLSFFSYKRVLS
jgi:acetyl esterase/lipase